MVAYLLGCCASQPTNGGRQGQCIQNEMFPFRIVWCLLVKRYDPSFIHTHALHPSMATTNTDADALMNSRN